jgi:hypothetical protein
MQIETNFSGSSEKSRLAIGLMAGLLDWRLGQVPSAVRGYGGKAKAISPDAIGPARFLGARLIEAKPPPASGVAHGAGLLEPVIKGKGRFQRERFVPALHRLQLPS